MKKNLIIIITAALAVAVVIAQQTLPSRDGASRIYNGSGYVEISTTTGGAATITPSGTTLAIPAATTITGDVAVTGAISATTTLTGTTGLSVGGGDTVLKILTGAATLNFGSVSTNSAADLTITVTGAGTNSVVILGLPPGAHTNIVYTGFVSATNTVTVRAQNISLEDTDPAAGSFRATVLQY